MFYKLLNAYTRNFSFPHRGLKYFLKTAKWLGIENRTYSKRLADNFYMQLNPSEHIQQQLFWYGYYERELGTLIKKILGPGDVFLDVGANIGYFSLLAAIQQPSAKVIAFEPVSSVFDKLEENISINNAKNITAIKVAVGKKNEAREIYISGADNMGMSSFQKPENYSGRFEKVNTIAIDEWIRSSGLPGINLIKLDIEGSEFAALEGMNETLQNFKPLVITEINPAALKAFDLAPADIFNYLKKLDYSGFLILKDARLEHVGDFGIADTQNVLFIHNENAKLF
jgi:FkbM family methyltransferase